MRSWRHDEEEGVALAPPSPALLEPPSEHVPAPACRDDDYAGAASPSASSNNKARMLLVPTRGAVGLVLAGLALFALVGTATGWWIQLDAASFLLRTTSAGGSVVRHGQHPPPRRARPLGVPIPFTCGNGNNVTSPTTCRRAVSASSPSSSAAEPPSSSVAEPPTSPVAAEPPSSSSGPAQPSCPDYFRHIHSDLSPWRDAGGITREAVERGRDLADFRLVVLGGRAYVETFRPAFQTRDVFTQWGILQLLARYPGLVPDLDLMFNCGDMPVVCAAEYFAGDDVPASSMATPPPVFHYCKDNATLDVLFPDWSFWGWPEVNIRPWAPHLDDVARENGRLPWTEREPYAYWKGNPDVSPSRADLLRCNATTAGAEEGVDWKARLFRQDWSVAMRDGFKGSDLAKKCTYRYKIYVEGRSWSVSEKYILACDSPMLLVDSPYRDFFSRGLVAGEHYWPIDAARKCQSIKLAVEWGNAHPARARRMGGEGSGFAMEELAMENVYDYMLHVLTEYARLLRYKPTVPEKAVELCPESMACPAEGRAREFMMESRERFVAGYEPCRLPPPFSADELEEMARREDDVRSKIGKMEKRGDWIADIC